MSDKLDTHLQKLVDLGESGTDIMHGELKNLMYECETKLLDTSQFVGQLQENPEYKYLSGRLDALTECYILTYNLAFALNERIVSRG
jgi:uncharacterized membrane protein YfbV (UPF0208 family)